MYRQFFMNITELLKTESIYSSDDIVERIQTYMQHNYQQNLTQDFISSLFFLNRNYLSTLFKLKTYLFRTPLVENDIWVSVQCFVDSSESIDSMLAC